MATINMHDAKTRLSDLVARAEAGEEIFIARRNKPAVRLVRVDADENAGARLAETPVHRRDRLSAPVVDAPLSGIDMDTWREMPGVGESDRTPFDGLPAAVEAGREFWLMKDGKPVARVIPVEPKSRGWGAWEGRCRLPDAFFDPLPEDELAAWDGSDEPAA